MPPAKARGIKKFLDIMPNIAKASITCYQQGFLGSFPKIRGGIIVSNYTHRPRNRGFALGSKAWSY